MTLLAPGWLVLGALAALVLVLHMRRRRQLDVPSVMLWRRLGNAAAPRRSLRWPTPNLLLLLQILTVLLIALAMAQPLFGGGRQDQLHTVYLLDASATMGATDQSPSRFGAATRWLSQRVEAASAQGGQRVSLISVDAEPKVRVARQANASGILPLIDNLAATDGTANWERAAALVPSLLREGEQTEIILLTDGTDAGDAKVIERFAALKVERAVFSTASATNVALTASIAATDAATGKWNASGSVRFFGPDPAALTIEALFQPAGTTESVAYASVDVKRPAGDGPVDATFDLALELPGPGAVTLRLPADAAAHDNSAYFVLHREPVKGRVLYLGEARGPLLAALQSVTGLQIVTAAELPAADTGFDLIIVDNVVVPRRPQTNVLWVGAGRISSPNAPQPLRTPYVTGWEADHPLSEQVDWTKLEPANAFRFTRLPGAVALAESAGVPLVQARTTPAGREVQIAFALDGAGWTGRSGFPVFVTNLVRWLGIDLGSVAASSCTVGVPCTIEAKLLGGRILNADGEQVWTGAAAEGTDFLLPATETSFVPLHAGLYRLEAKGETRVLPVNAVATESTLAPLADMAPAAAPQAVTSGAWRWILALAFAVLVIEAILAGRGGEQFLKRVGLSRENPLALRRRLQLGFRVAAGLFLLFALAALPLLAREPAEDIVVVIGNDLATPSANPERERLLREVETRLADGGGARAGVVSTGSVTRVGADLGALNASLLQAPTVVNAPGTNLEEAVMLAAAMVPGNRTGRVILATDGNETAGRVSAALTVLRDRGVAVDIEPITELPTGEVLVESVNAPQKVFAGDAFLMDAVVFSQGLAQATVSVKRDGNVVLEQQVALAPGRNRIETTVPATALGSVLLEVTVTSLADTFTQNNQNGTIVTVAAAPSLLVIAPEFELGDYFAKALKVQGLDAKVIRPREAPTTIDKWLVHDAVILMNMPAIALATDQQEALEQFVEVHGRGLLILGGENSFGPGGYFETPFERLSPLSARVPHDRPQVAMVFVLDRSGSMSAAADETGRLTRLDVAKSATVAAVGVLEDEARMGVVVFDHEAAVIVPLQPKNTKVLEDTLTPLVPGGGTYIFPGLLAAMEMLRGVDAPSKHIVVMTDGLSQEADFRPIFLEAERNKITISAVAISSAADPRQPLSIAEGGKGAFYHTDDMRALPSILTQEALMLSSTTVKTDTVPVTWVDRSADFLANLPDRLPPVHGYVRTSPKPEANIHLSIKDAEDEVIPLMATWRYGNGQVLAFAAHSVGPNTEDWLPLPSYPLMWSQVIRHFLPDTAGPGLNVNLRRAGDEIRIGADLLDPKGLPLQRKTVTATIEGGTGGSVTLRETQPGHYEGVYVASEMGSYKVNVSSDALTAEAAMYVAYPARYAFVRSDFDKLRALAAATGGKVLLGDDSTISNAQQWAARPGWRLWTLIALALFFIDLGIRHVPNLFGLARRPAAGRVMPATA